MKVSRRIAMLLVSLALALPALGLTAGPATAMPRNCNELTYLQAMWLIHAQESHIRWEETGYTYWLEVEEKARFSLQEVEEEMWENHC